MTHLQLKLHYLYDYFFGSSSEITTDALIAIAVSPGPTPSRLVFLASAGRLDSTRALRLTAFLLCTVRFLYYWDT